MRHLNNPLISVLTPSWNRGNLIEKVHNSISSQTYRNLEWVVVNDGSSDNSQAVLESLIARNEVAMTCITFLARSGKCRADNILLDSANGDFVVWCDSDDILKPMAIDTLHKAWVSIPEDEKDSYIGVAGMCTDISGKIQSSGSYPFSSFSCKWHELSQLHGMRGDMCIMIDRKKVGTARFPEYDLVMNESGFWRQFMDMRILCIPDILKIMKRDTENRVSGSNKMEYSKGKAYSIALADSASFKKLSFLDQVRLSCRYHRYCTHGDLSFAERNKIFSVKKTFSYFIGLLPGRLLAWKDTAQNKVVKTHHIFERGRGSKVEIKLNKKASLLLRNS